MSRRKGKVSESFAPWCAERARFLSQTERERVKHAMTCPSLVRQAWPWLENLLWPRMLYHIASSSTLFWGSVLFLDVFGWLAEAPEEASTCVFASQRVTWMEAFLMKSPYPGPGGGGGASNFRPIRRRRRLQFHNLWPSLASRGLWMFLG